MEQLIALIAYFFTISVAAERIVDIIKRIFLKNKEVNGVVYQLMAAILGALAAFYSPPPIAFVQLHPYLVIAVTGLCVSGGSSFWNGILTNLNELAKNLKAAPALK